MIGGRGKLPSLSAALAGIPAGLQCRGPWSGRRQLTVRFAVEAETATIYTADALTGELTRLMKRSRYHSIAIIGDDALAEEEFLRAAFREKPALPLMLDHDGQRPASLEGLLDVLSLVQVSLDGSEAAPLVERVCWTLAATARRHVAHAVALTPQEGLSDGALLRIVEQVHKASAETQLVLHRSSEADPEQDRRWLMWLEQAMAVHGDVRVLPGYRKGMETTQRDS